MVGPLHMRRVVGRTLRMLRRRWLPLLIVIPGLSVAEGWLWSLLPLTGGMATPGQMLVTALGYAHVMLTNALVAGLTAATVLLSAPTATARLRQTFAAVAGGFPGLILFGLLMVLPTVAGNAVLLGATRDVSFDAPDVGERMAMATSLTVIASFALLMVFNAFWVTLPGVAVLQRPGALRAMDRAFHLTEGARLAIGGGWFLYVLVAIAPLRLLIKALLSLAPLSTAVHLAGQAAFSVAGVIWLTAGAVIYRELSGVAGDGAASDTAEVFD
ncbi:MAG: hypothetical protein JWP35_1311 [Caulobacter sp.]|nr:hypothetical protein [Caulobacter sp.]